MFWTKEAFAFLKSDHNSNMLPRLGDEHENLGFRLFSTLVAPNDLSALEALIRRKGLIHF